MTWTRAFRRFGRAADTATDTDRGGQLRAEYEAAKGSPDPAVIKGKELTPGTWRWLCVRYFSECADYLRYDERQKRVRGRVLEATFDEPIAPDSRKFFRDMPLTKMTTDAIEVLRDRKLAVPEGANNRVKQFAPFSNGRRERKGLMASRSFHIMRRATFHCSRATIRMAITPGQSMRFGNSRKRHPIGTKPRFAFALLLYTGQRRSDVIRFGKQHTKRGVLTFTQHKGRNRRPHTLVLPILPVLQKVINASQCGDMTYLVNELGRPFTDAGSVIGSVTVALKLVFLVALMACGKRARRLPRTTARQRTN